MEHQVLMRITVDDDRGEKGGCKNVLWLGLVRGEDAHK